jgi:hypothetical protein
MSPWYSDFMFWFMYWNIFRSNTRHYNGQCSKAKITIFLQQYDWVNHEKHCVLSVNHYLRVLLLLYYTIISLQGNCTVGVTEVIMVYLAAILVEPIIMWDLMLAQQCCLRLRLLGSPVSLVRVHNTLNDHTAFIFRVKHSKNSSYARL